MDKDACPAIVLRFHSSRKFRDMLLNFMSFNHKGDVALKESPYKTKELNHIK